MASTDPVAPDDAGGAPLKVYAPGLDRTAGIVDDGLNNTFNPAVRGVFAVYEMGTPFGAKTLSPTLDAARTLHHECLVRASATLGRYIWASAVLVEAVRTVKANYREADLASAANSAEVSRILTDALTAAQARAQSQSYADSRETTNAQAYGSGYAASPQSGSGA